MAHPRGLSTKSASQRLITILTVTASVVVAVAETWLVTSRAPVSRLLLHSLSIMLIALATYSVMAFPPALSSVPGALAILASLWAWVMARQDLLGLDAAAAGALVAIAGWQRHRRAKRLRRLEQVLDDLEEDIYLKEQNAALTQHTHEALARKSARYQQLQAIAESLSRLVQLKAIAKLTVERVFELIGKSEACLLFLVDRERQELALYASKRAPHLSAIHSKHGDQFDRYALRTHRPLLVNDVRRDFRFSVAGDLDRPIGSVIACPLLVGESAEGVLRLDSAQPGAYTQDDLRFLDILLGLVETAITNARLFAQTQQLAMTDGLTGLYRRQPFLDQLSREVARAARKTEAFAVLMLDLDHFKRYNDLFGHPAGDRVLKAVADLLRVGAGPDGVCARYGGEEFSVLLPRASRQQAAELAERIRGLVEQQGHPSGHGPDQRIIPPPVASPEATSGPSGSEAPLHGAATGGGITISVGVSVFPEDAQLELELIRVADQRLYQAKRAGRNRVVSALDRSLV